jgi:hypothetical protein
MAELLFEWDEVKARRNETRHDVSFMGVAHAPSGTTKNENAPALKLLTLWLIFEGVAHAPAGTTKVEQGRN